MPMQMRSSHSSPTSHTVLTLEFEAHGSPGAGRRSHVFIQQYESLAHAMPPTTLYAQGEPGPGGI